MEKLITILLKQNSIKSFLSVLGGWLFTLILPISKFILIVLLLVVFDTVTGIWSSIKLSRKITSKRLSSTLSKFIAYSLAIILSHAMQIVFINGTILETLQLVYYVSFYICLIEFQSNIENIGEITGVDIWSKIKSKISIITKTIK